MTEARSWSGRPTADPLRMIGTHEDVSATHLAAEVLAAAEEESRLAFDRSRVATCLVSERWPAHPGEPRHLRPPRPQRGRTAHDELPRGDPPRRRPRRRRPRERPPRRATHEPAGHQEVRDGQRTGDLGRRDRLRRAQPGRDRAPPHRADPRRHARARPPGRAHGRPADRAPRRLAAGPGHGSRGLVARAVRPLRPRSGRPGARLPESATAVHPRELAAPEQLPSRRPGRRAPPTTWNSRSCERTAPTGGWKHAARRSGTPTVRSSRCTASRWTSPTARPPGTSSRCWPRTTP